MAAALTKKAAPPFHSEEVQLNLRSIAADKDDVYRRPTPKREQIIMKRLGRAAFWGMLALSMGAAAAAWGQAQMPVSLYKLITVKDEILIGLNAEEVQSLGGQEKAAAGTIASALADRKALTVWQYAVHRGANGELQVAPLHQIGLLAHVSLRVEPYSSPLAVVPHN
jgi:hypothetical protein